MTVRDLANPATAKEPSHARVAELRAIVDEEGTDPNRGSASGWVAPLIGRDHEVSLLKDRWEQAQEGMGQVVLLIGEPGLGKSRLVSTIKQHVEEQSSGERIPHSSPDPPPDSPIVEWRCSQRFQNTGLYPACDFFERILGFGHEHTGDARFEQLVRYLEAYKLARPDVVALFASLLLMAPNGHVPRVGLSPVREREEMFRALREWLRAYSGRQPILFVIEDLHWVDASTLEFLGQFLSEGLHDRILTLLTFRPEFQTPWPAVAHQTSLALNRLTRRQVGDLMRQNLECPLPQPLIEEICNRTGGVPLFVEELSKMLQEPEALDQAAEGIAPDHVFFGREIPATLQDLIMARLSGMTSNPEVAQLASVLGREFSHQRLAAVACLDEPALQTELGTLVRAGILYQKGRPPRCTYTFKHALLEDALRDALAEGKRRDFHRRIGEVLEARFPRAVETQPELLAHHFTEADMADKAIGYWLMAGLRSRERSANLEAISHLTKGLELLGTLDESPDRDARELEFLNPLGTVYIAARGYGAPEVGPVFQRARELCERSGQAPQLFAIMWGAWAWHVVRADLLLCMQLADEAMALAERVNDPGMLMEALFLPAVTSVFRGDFAAARVHCVRALADYDNRERTRQWAGITGEDSGVAHRCYLSVALWHLGYPEQALRVNQEAVALARDIGQPFTLAFALEHRAWLHNQCGLAIEARAAAEEEIAISTEQGFAYWLASATLFKADSLVAEGQWKEALPLLLNGLHDLRATGTALDLTLHLGFLGSAYTQAGRFDEAAQALDEGLELAEKNDERFFEAELYRLRGELLIARSTDDGAAEQCFRKSVEIARRQRSKAWELRAGMSLARLWRRQGKRDEARAALTDMYGAYAEGFATPDVVSAQALLETLTDERMREDIAGAVKYVRGCIPDPMHGPVSVDWRYVPSSNLGGDTIGYHWIDDDHLALHLIDVMGHGMDSALLSVTITNVLRSGSLPGVDMRRPDQVLAALNDAFQGDHHGNKYFTIWYGVYRKSTTTLSWSGGGHHPSILLRRGEPDPVLLSSSGPTMGAVRGMEFPAESCPVTSDARLVIFSDGIFEILRDGKVAWNLHACIEYLASQNPREGTLMDELLAHIRHLRGSTQLEDDLSIIEARFG